VSPTLQQQTRSTLEIVRELQDRKDVLEEDDDASEDSIDQELALLLEKDENDNAQDAPAAAKAIEANLRDLAKVPWIPTVVCCGESGLMSQAVH